MRLACRLLLMVPWFDYNSTLKLEVVYLYEAERSVRNKLSKKTTFICV
jgi:hypothetical protein